MARIDPARQPPSVAVRRLYKRFDVPHSRGSTMRARVADRLRRRPQESLPALTDVSFEVRPGECFGIVGRNGSGKSTLLKCVAGIYDVDSGEIAAEGRLSPFVELGVGADSELSGRDNAVISGVLLGLQRREVLDRLDDIVAFAELEEFVELPLKNYSSGMGVRLLFSVSLEVDADVLLVDEVLAVGDAAFKEKCFAAFEELKRRGHTILFVTHDMEAMERFCDRAMLMEHGHVVEIGPASEIARRYAEINAEGRARAHEPAPAELPPAGRRRYRPTMAGDGLRRLATVTFTLAAAQFKVHYLGSVLGYLWAVMRPLMLFAVTYFVFTRVGSFGKGVQDYGVYLLTSIVLWTFFAEATSGAASCLLVNQDLLRKLRFPRLAIPLAVVLRALFNLVLNLIAVAVLVAISGPAPRLSWLELPPLIALLVLLTAGVATLLSALFVRVRDVGQIWTVLLQLLFFGSSVLYVVTQFSRNLQRVMIANPLTSIFTQTRHVLIDPQAPTAAQVAGGTAFLLIPLGITVATAVLGLWLFARETPRMAERL